MARHRPGIVRDDRRSSCALTSWQKPPTPTTPPDIFTSLYPPQCYSSTTLQASLISCDSRLSSRSSHARLCRLCADLTPRQTPQTSISTHGTRSRANQTPVSLSDDIFSASWDIASLTVPIPSIVSVDQPRYRLSNQFFKSNPYHMG